MKSQSVVKYSIAVGLLAAAGLASASPYCTDAPRSEWQDSIAFQQKLRDQGLSVDDFEITRGGCYKAEAWDKKNAGSSSTTTHSRVSWCAHAWTATGTTVTTTAATRATATWGAGTMT